MGFSTAAKPSSVTQRAFLAALLGAIAVAGCTATERYGVLTIFFDGVPDPNAPEERAGVSGQYFDDNAPRAAIGPRNDTVRHKPFAEKNCEGCHPKDRAFFLGAAFERRGGCYKCHEHEEFQKRLEASAFLHGPVAGGNCLSCHDPHESFHDHLLLAPDPDLCYRCHFRESVVASSAHQDWTEEKCLGCHDPHGGETRFFVRPQEEA